MTHGIITSIYLAAYDSSEYSLLADHLGYILCGDVEIGSDGAVWDGARGMWLTQERIVELVATIEDCSHAEAVCAMWDGDGQLFSQKEIDFDNFCDAAAVDVFGHSGCARYVFANSSTIVICGDGWDLGFDEPVGERGIAELSIYRYDGCGQILTDMKVFAAEETL